MSEQSREMTEGVAVEHVLSLLVRSGHDVTHRSQSCRLQRYLSGTANGTVVRPVTS